MILGLLVQGCSIMWPTNPANVLGTWLSLSFTCVHWLQLGQYGQEFVMMSTQKEQRLFPCTPVFRRVLEIAYRRCMLRGEIVCEDVVPWSRRSLWWRNGGFGQCMAQWMYWKWLICYWWLCAWGRHAMNSFRWKFAGLVKAILCVLATSLDCVHGKGEDGPHSMSTIHVTDLAGNRLWHVVCSEWPWRQRAVIYFWAVCLMIDLMQEFTWLMWYSVINIKLYQITAWHFWGRLDKDLHAHLLKEKDPCGSA